MRLLIWIIILAGIVYGGKWLYDNGYVDEYIQKFKSSSFSESFGNTVKRTSDFVTDKAVKETNY